jgi:hypothetical protein
MFVILSTLYKHYANCTDVCTLSTALTCADLCVLQSLGIYTTSATTLLAMPCSAMSHNSTAVYDVLYLHYS